MSAVAGVAAAPGLRRYELPWTASAEQERLFRRALRNVLVPVLVLGLLMPLLPLPEREPDAVDEPPARVARFLSERAPPPPAPTVARPVDTPAEPEAPEPTVPTPEPVPQPVADVPTPAPEPAADATSQARERASAAGLLPFADSLADLRDSSAVAAVTQAEARVSAAEGTAASTERALVTSRAGQASAGVSTAGLSRDTGGGGLAARERAAVAAPAVGGAAAGPGSAAAADGVLAERSREEIEQVFDRNKGAIHALYSRALRSDPTLQGRLVLRLTIAPDGTVTDCEVVESELGDAELERRLVQRVLLFRFEDREVATVTTTKPIEFFPA